MVTMIRNNETRSFSRKALVFGALSILAASFVPAVAQDDDSTGIQIAAQNADEFLIVDCLLPGQIRRLGRMSTYVTARRAIKTSVRDCQIRGGEYVAEDRGSYAHALKIWLPMAKSGDPQAQLYLGEIFEKGLGLEPNYQTAAQWYRRAAEQGFAPAQINLGNLYEKGLGVPRDPKLALTWYRKASGLDTAGLKFVSAETTKEVQDLRSEVARQREESSALKRQVGQLEGKLKSARDQLRKQKQSAQRQSRTINQANRSLAAEKKKIAKEARDLEARRSKLAALEVEHRRQLEALKSAKAGGSEESKAAGKLLAEDRQEVASLRRELDQLRKERSRWKTAQEQVSAARKSIASLEKTQQDRIASMEQAKRAAESGHEAEKAKLKAEQSKVAALDKKLQKLRAELANKEKQQQKFAGAEQRFSSLESEYKRRLDAAEKAKQEAEKGKQLSSQELKRELKNAAQLKVQLAEARADIASREAKIAKQNVLLQSKEDEIAAKRNKLAEVQKELGRLSSQVDKRRTEIALLQKGGAERAASGINIRIIDPKIDFVTRGLPVVRLRANTTKRLIVGQVLAPKGLMSLVVNDKEETFDKKGLFRTRVSVLPNGTRVSIVAIDNEGKKKELEFLLKAGGEAAKVVQSSEEGRLKGLRIPNFDFGRYYALVIGNNEYRFLPKLETAVADAQGVSAILRKKFGFEVTTLLNANRYQILSALNEFRKKLTKKDNLLIYYAGHGELDKANQRGQWLPIDAEPTSTANWISNVSITDILNSMNAKEVLLVADSCYSGSLTRSALARIDAGMTDEAKATWITTIAKKRARVAMTSGGLQPVLDGGGGKHSIFAKAFIDALQKSQGIIEASRIHELVAAGVSYAASAVRYDQLPEYAPIKHAGHGGGEFFFVPKRG